ncbi:hypothetical protein FZEAL_2186 [Fusarium zealandicum]|uniref:serine--tRNA ligase n=1 Tax=Fusarium zealandicum TaxID=1053134 RepID=A0A8H4XN06_9HYPO|nr:hypothetical protein FZEAL_2186 [Fusarium zealandicum]
MASGAGPTLAHRSVASIRGGPTQGSGPSAPHTPNRSIVSTYGSPSTIRADDDIVIIELGSRHIRIGFAGDSCPKATLECSPKDHCRVGDFRGWQQPRQSPGQEWSKDHEFWRYDIRELDLGLCRDKLERVIQDAFSRQLLIDSRPRRLGLVLDPAVPVPLLTAILDTMFNRFQSPSISLMSTPVMSAVSAGVRSALVIDMGWAETVVTSIYEYREVKSTSTIRGGRKLVDLLYDTLQPLIRGENDDDEQRAISFEECEDIVCRLMWCKASDFRISQRQSTQLETVDEQEELEAESAEAGVPTGVAQIPVNTGAGLSTVEVPFEKLAEVCDEAFFDPSAPRQKFDDHDLPVHLLVYRHLLQLPIDARAVCMSRMIFSGGCSNILGIKQRIVDDISAIVKKRGWVPVLGKVVDRHRNTARLHRQSSSSSPSEESPSPPKSGEGQDKAATSAADVKPEYDPIEAKVTRQRDATPQIQGQFRVLHSLGPWVGGSLLCQLKVPAMAIIDRDVWLQQGAHGAVRPSDVDIKAQQRQSMTAGGYVRGSGGHHGNWTLGSWGYIFRLQLRQSLNLVSNEKLTDKPPTTMNRTLTRLRCRNLQPRARTHPILARAFADVKRPPSAPKPIVDIKHIRQNPDLYQQTCVERNYRRQAQHPAQILELHTRWQDLQRQGRALRERSNLLRRLLSNPATSSGDEDLKEVRQLSREEIQGEARQLKQNLSVLEKGESLAVAQMEELALELPNLTHEDTPKGDQPEVLSYISDPPIFKESPEDKIWRSHVHIGTELGLFDFAGAATASGWGWYYLLGEAAQLEQALVQYALAVATRHGWTQVSPPSMVYSHIGAACGFQPRDQNGEQQVYSIAQSADDVERGVPEMCLTGTSEIALAGMKANSTIDPEDLPLKRVAVSRCYRAEAGARGADTKGLYRVHEFTKVEMFAWTAAEEDASQEIFDEMLDMQTEILSSLGLHCRILSMPAHDLGASATRKIDMEAFFPSRRDNWGEVTSASMCTDYQTRRLGTRTRVDGKLAFPWTANGTALAVPRVLAAILENGWDEEAKTVAVPECLRPWMDGKDKIGLGGRRSSVDRV